MKRVSLFVCLFCDEGPRSRSYGRTAALRLIVQHCDEDDQFFLFFTSNGAPMEWNWQGKTEVLGENTVPVPLCPPQIPHGLTRDRTPAFAVCLCLSWLQQPLFVATLRVTSQACSSKCPATVKVTQEDGEFEIRTASNWIKTWNEPHDLGMA
jgi:hypothetical protein